MRAHALRRWLVVILTTLSLVQNSFAAIINSAVAVGDYQSTPVYSTASLVSIPVTGATPQMQLLKGSVFNDENGDGAAQVGETIGYSFTVTNTGNVTLSNVTISDPGITVTGGPIASLAAGAADSTTFHGTYTLILADINSGQKSNTASTSAQTPQLTTITDQSDSTNPGDDTGADNDPTITPIPKAVIDAVNNDFSGSPVNGIAGGSTPSIFGNDTLNGLSFPAAAVQGSITNNGGITGLTLSSSGTLTVPAGTPPGSYTVDYEICETANPSNCDTAQVLNLVVSAATIVAADDDFTATPLNGFTGGNTATVYGNDTLNGSPFVAATVTPAITNDGGLAGVTINAADGTLNVPAGTPAGNYTVTYRICEIAIPANCDTANVTVVVNPPVIDAQNDNFAASPINGLGGGTSPTVFTNDTLNGSAFLPSAVVATISNNGGLAGAAIDASGGIVVPAGTTAGTYNVVYRICEVVNPSNCDEATAVVVVSAATILANDDDFSASPVSGLGGGSTTTVYVNDSLNGAPFAPGQVQASITNNGGLAGLAINPDGTMAVPANTAAGTYSVTYQICELLNLTNCDLAVATVVVQAPAIVATDDDFSASPQSGLTGGTTATVYSNDTLGGLPFAATAVMPTITNAGGLTGVTINPDGTLTVPAGTPAGTYPVTYQICEVLNPTNCDTGVATVVVQAPAIDAVVDDFSASPVSGVGGGTTATVFSNDLLGGSPLLATSVDATIDNDGGLAGVTINPDGTLTVPPGTPAGSYPVSYQICEKVNPANCDTAIATVVVSSATINAVDDNFTAAPINGANGGATATVLSNDTLNGSAFAASTVTTSVVNNGGLTGATIDSAGVIHVPADTVAGTYVVNYRICENLNPGNCDAANATVVVAPPAIVANDDNFSSTPVSSLTGGTTPTVYSNDLLNGVAVDQSKITSSITNAGGLTGVTINPNGTLTIPAGTPAGTYLVTYQICEVLNPANCDTAISTVMVAPSLIDAVADNFSSSPINGVGGGTTPTVLTNDRLNGAPFAATAITLSLVSGGGLTGLAINPDGTLTVPPGSPAGNYTAQYRICENLNPTNCDTATVVVSVSAATIDAVNDDFTAAPVNGFIGGSTVTVLTNDQLNGVPVAAASVNTSISNTGGLIGVTIDAAGVITVPANTAAGTYPVAYTICEKLNPTNCDTAIATITVTAAPILADNDDFSASPLNGLTGGNTPTVLTNDRLNGAVIDPSDVTVTVQNGGGLISVVPNVDGTLTIGGNQPAGTYTVRYQLCENLNPTNCDVADVTIVVNPPAIAANDNDFTSTPVNGISGGSTPSIYGNDTVNGLPFAPTSVTPQIVSNGGLVGVGINASNGSLTVPPSTPAGSYPVMYEICEVLNPANCDQATVTVVVAAITIVANDDNFVGSPFTAGHAGTTPSVLGNDQLNGGPISTTDVTVTMTDDAGTGATIDPAGVVTVPASVAPGTYTLTYQICEVLNPSNCDTANVTVVVQPKAIAANDDNFSSSPLSGLTAGATPSVFPNDSLDGAAPTSGTVTASLDNNGGLTGATVNSDGTITVPAGTPAGTYVIRYRICETANITNCAFANATVVVSLPAISAADDNFTATPVGPGGTTNNIFSNDTLNGAPFAPSTVNATITDFGGLPGSTLNADGTIALPSNAVSGDHVLTYQICQKVNPTNCDTATVTVRVPPKSIDAVNDDRSSSPVNGFSGATIPSVLTNDTLDAALVDPTEMNFTIVDVGGLFNPVPNPDGTITLPAGQPAGAHQLTYQICEKAYPANCDTAIVTIVVQAPAIAANDDDFSATPVSGTTPSIFANDTLNGIAVVPGQIVPTILNDGGVTGLTLNPSTGVLTIPPGTAPGPYQVSYQICEVLNPTNCDTATVSLVVATSPGAVVGTVYFDKNGNGILDSSDTRVGAGYSVELIDSSGVVRGSDTTNDAGDYSITAPVGSGYSLRFRSPAGVLIGAADNVELSANSVANYNIPVDPSGIVYDSVTRQPVSGATVSLTDRNGNLLPPQCFVDAGQRVQVTDASGGYRFDIIPGADNAACPVGQTEYRISVTTPAGYKPGLSTVLTPQAGPLNVSTCPIAANLGAACVITPSGNPPSGTPVRYFDTFLIGQGDPNVIHNHLPIDPIITDAAGLTKKALITQVKRGERVPYVIEATGVTVSPATVVDVLPVGLDFVPGSATANGSAITPVIKGNSVEFVGLQPDASGKIKLEYVAAVTLASATGPKINKARIINPATGAVFGSAQTTITVMVDHVFDCGDVIGKVFDDKNRDGYQDQGEKGLPSVRLVTVKGVQITTDKNGLFHVPCAEIPDAAIGSNFILKLDTRTLPTGYRITTENPRVVRLTAGKATKLNFGASVGRVVKFDVTGEAFGSNSAELKPKWVAAVDKLVNVLAVEKSTLRLTYIAKTDGSQLGQQRLDYLERLIAEKWGDKAGSYQLPIEKRLVSKLKKVAQ